VTGRAQLQACAYRRRALESADAGLGEDVVEADRVPGAALGLPGKSGLIALPGEEICWSTEAR